MRTLLLALLLAVPVWAQVGSEESFIEQVNRATVLLYAQDSEGSMKMLCTGTLFQKAEKSYRIVTAAHCTSTDDTVHERVKVESYTFYVTLDESKRKQFSKARVIASGYQQRGDDFSVLEVEEATDVEAVALGDESLERPGASVFNIASPLGLGKQVFKGFVSMVRLDRPVIEDDINWQDAMLIQISVGGGSSGSAVLSFAQRGIVAFLVGSISRGQSPNVVAIPVSKFKVFLKAFEEKKYKWFVPGVSVPD